VIHVIKRGETIYSIARSYGVSPQEVLSYNNISDARTVQAGTKIRIPGTSAGTPATSGVPPAPAVVPQKDHEAYKVQKNDTLYGLARKHKLSLAELLAMNGFAPDYVIKTGETIRVPAIASGSRPSQPGTTTPTAQPPGTTVVKVNPNVSWPIKAKEVAYITGKLNGVQLTGERQEGVKSLTGGTVVSAGPYRGFGRVAIVQTPGGYLYVYGGCETLSVKEGDKVVSGAELGRLGIDTKSAKSQLFFFVYKGNTPVDPSKAPRA
jgi:LysM repeat protein